MAAKKKSTKAAPRRTGTAAAAKKKTTKKNYGYAAIPGAAATVGLVMANKEPINMLLSEGVTKGSSWSNFVNRITRRQYIEKDVKYGLAGAAAGYAIKEIVPNSGILGKGKKAIGGIAKKIPKVI